MAPQNTLVIEPMRMQGVAVGRLVAALGGLAEAAHRGLAVADRADDEARHLRLEKDDGAGELDGLVEQLVGLRALCKGSDAAANAHAASNPVFRNAALSLVMSPRPRGRAPYKMRAPRFAAEARRAYYGDWGRELVHAQRNEIVLDGVGDGRVAAVGERERRAVGAEHRIKIDAFELVARCREQLAARRSRSSCLI